MGAALERRRLNAYLVRAAYLANNARDVLPATVDAEDREKHREIRRRRLLVDRLVAGVLGEDWCRSPSTVEADVDEFQPSAAHPSRGGS
ncbi:MAG: hypothetical protein R2711_17720 [Acidimicrobiales bacterium]